VGCTELGGERLRRLDPGEHDGSVGEQQRLVHIVSDEQHRWLVPLPQLCQQPVHAQPRERVQSTKGLIQQQ
jgi:hypothetical protein